MAAEPKQLRTRVLGFRATRRRLPEERLPRVDAMGKGRPVNLPSDLLGRF